MYAIIDVETTGGKYNQESITDIAIFKFDGEKITDQLISLVNPEKPIQQYVQKLTGITDGMVKTAPKFFQLAKRVIEITKDTILVGHNIAFDYRMLRLEFERLGYFYECKTLDTIHLSERLLPELEAYGLEKVCKALGIHNPGRHRAEGDARATLQLFELLLEKDHEKKVKGQLHEKVPTTQEFAGNPFEDLLRTYKQSIGIYFLFNAKGKVIYLGRSNSLGNRINKHFLATTADALAFQKEIAYLEIEETGSEVVARLKEFEALNRLKPKYNYGAYDKFFSVVIGLDSEGVLTTNNQKITKPLHYFFSEARAKQGLWGFIKTKKLVPEKTSSLIAKWMQQGELTQFPVGLTPRMMSRWSTFKTDQILVFRGKDPYEKSFVMVEKGRVRGYGFFELNHQINELDVVKNALVKIHPSPYADCLVKHFVEKGAVEKRITLRSPV
jgi:DNA polymerase III subunit epsilon